MFVYELPNRQVIDGVQRPILQRRFHTSDGRALQQMSSDTFRILPDGPDLKYVED